jgi:hypothetical protein
MVLCMAEDIINGLLVNNTKANTIWIIKKVMEAINGKMGRDISVNGRKTRGMERVA